MPEHRRKRKHARFSPVAAVVALAVSVVGCADDEVASETESAALRTLWHAGSFRTLPALHGDLVSFVASLDHPDASGYGKLSTERRGDFERFLEGLFAAIEAGHDDGWAGDWCGVQALADEAGYEVFRYRDEVSGRWFVYGHDRTKYGQAYFVVNPAAKRDLVIEVPHASELGDGGEMQIGEEGARLFKDLAARVLIVNKEHRCSDEDLAECTTGCSQSDVAHSTSNTFHVLHTWLNDRDPDTRFAQIHGMTGADDSYAEIGDGTRNDVDLGAVSVEFADHLADRVAEGDWVHACQAYAGKPPEEHCGDSNVQARYTNGAVIDDDQCPGSTTQSSGRFLHIEQQRTLRDAVDDGWWWKDVSAALRDTWPVCDLAGGGTECALGSAQTDYAGLSCSP